MKQILVASIAALATVAFSASPSQAGSVFNASSYTSTISLAGTSVTPTGVAFNGTNYYTASGGYSSAPEGMLNMSGGLISSLSPTPGLDFRSVFTDSSGNVYAKGFNNSTIYEQTSFGQFASVVTLAGLTNSQEGVVLDSSGTRYIGLDGNTVQEWDLSGNLIANVALPSAPSSNAISAFGSDWLIYSNGTLDAFDDTTGALVDSTTLVGANTDWSAYYGQAYANGYFFVGTDSAGYAGYQIGVPNQVPEPASMTVLGAGLLGLGLFKRSRTVR